MIDTIHRGTAEAAQETVTAEAETLALVMIVDLAPAAVEDFQSYEDIVLGMLPRHGGRLERRMRSTDQGFECHLITFDCRAGYDAFIADPDRCAARVAMPETGIDQRVVIVHEVPNGTNTVDGGCGPRN